MSDKIVLYQVRFMFKCKDNDSLMFKIVTDTVDGLKKFVDSIKSLDNVVCLAAEYLCEYDCSLLGDIHNIFNLEDK